jgi:hypothetical protein
MDAQQITLALSDDSNGYPTSPDRVALSALREFASDVEMFIKGEGREVDVAKLEVAVVNGSLAVQTAPIAAAPTLFRDLRSLNEGELLDRLDPKRRNVIERWQKHARGSKQRAYRISAPFLLRPVIVNASSDYRADDADQWVQVERYVRGEITDLGGSGRVNAHVRLPDGTPLTVSTDRELLRADKVNRLYKQAMLRIRAQYNVLTQELREAQLIEFIEYAPSFDDESFARLTRRGAQAWKDVEDATAWVEDLRGGEH